MPYKYPITLQCAFCKNPFETFQRAKSRLAKFCSRQCSSKNRITTTQYRSCEYCEKPFPLAKNKGYKYQANFCSRKCAKVKWGEDNTQSIEERFWRYVNKDGPIQDHCPKLGRCWVWTAGTRGGKNHKYGAIDSDLTHRISWRIHKGRIPTGLWVLHKCDNPPCVNPDHLFLGTVQDNVRDAIQKGRWRNPPPNLGNKNRIKSE